VAGRVKAFLGKAMFDGWVLRRKLAETRRPALVKALCWIAAAGGALLVAEGVIVGWFLPHVAPRLWTLDFVYGRYPWIKLPQWLAAAAMIIVGLIGLYGGAVLIKRRQLGAYFTAVLTLALAATGAVLLYAGVRFTGAFLTGAGAVNLGAALVVYLLLSLGWYTIDPLALHREPYT